jgi:hypothetical protein
MGAKVVSTRMPGVQQVTTCARAIHSDTENAVFNVFRDSLSRWRSVAFQVDNRTRWANNFRGVRIKRYRKSCRCLDRERVGAVYVLILGDLHGFAFNPATSVRVTRGFFHATGTAIFNPTICRHPVNKLAHAIMKVHCKATGGRNVEDDKYGKTDLFHLGK